MKRIMFNDAMSLTKAAIDGRKTQLRVVLRPQPDYSEKRGIVWKHRSFGLDLWGTQEGACANFIHDVNHEKSHSIPFHKGDATAVAQCYKSLYELDQIKFGQMVDFSTSVGWKNKGAVEASLMPYVAEILSMSLQRLQNITEEEILAEGVTKQDTHSGLCLYLVSSADHVHDFSTSDWREAAEIFFDRKLGKGTWKDNPWVLVYRLKIIENKEYAGNKF